MPLPPDAIELGVLVGAHGVRGALRMRRFGAEALGPWAARDVPLWLAPAGSPAGWGWRVHVRSVAPVPGGPLARLVTAELQRRDAAEALEGARVWVDRAALGPLAADEFFLTDVLGLEVVSRAGIGLGRVRGLTSNGAQDLAEVEHPSEGAWLLPLLPQFVVDVAQQLVVDVPPGMLPEALDQQVHGAAAGAIIQGSPDDGDAADADPAASTVAAQAQRGPTQPAQRPGRR
jgi:16S rRNA processing protein RimM